MHGALLLGALAGLFVGWVWKKCHVAWQDWRSLIARMKNARSIFWHEARVTAVVAVAVIVAVRALL
jgi:hypothetical protein